MKIARETWIVVVIGLADLISTIVFINHHGAQEANPLFRQYWEMGIGAFIAAKLTLLIGPLMMLEWARQRNPIFVQGALRITITGYLGLYSIGFLHLNRPAEAAPKMNETSYVRPIHELVMSRAEFLAVMKNSPMRMGKWDWHGMRNMELPPHKLLRGLNGHFSFLK